MSYLLSSGLPVIRCSGSSSI
jgi:hypothetical protein